MAKNSNNKRPLKKIQKKYALAGFNSGSVAMSRQNPYYLGQVEEDQAKENFANATEEATYAAKQAKEKKKLEEEMLKQQKKDATQSSLKTLGSAASKDMKAGNLGKFMLRNPNTPVAGVNTMTEVPASAVNTASASWAPVAGSSAAPTAATIGQAGQAVNPIMTSAGGNAATQMVVGQAAPTMSTVGGAPITGAANVAGTGAAAAGASTGGLMAANMSGLASAGIGVALTAGGMVTERATNDKKTSTATQKELTGNTVGEGLKGAGTGWSYGALAGSIVPGVGNVVGGVVGAVVGAGVGIYKGVKENKATKQEAKDMQRQDRMTRAAYQSALVNSRLSTMNTGFGLNSSTNMNNNNTTAYGQNMGTQYARTGGAKKVTGGQIVPMGKNAVKFLGRKHESGGIDLDQYTEVEGDETMQKGLKMKNGKKNDYFFSSFLKVGNKTFAQKHEEILKSGLPKRVIDSKLQDLAKLQEQVAGRDPEEVGAGEKAYRLGGQMLFKKGGVDKVTACPEGYVLLDWRKKANGVCVPIDYKNETNALDEKYRKEFGEDWENNDEAIDKYSDEESIITQRYFDDKSPLFPGLDEPKRNLRGSKGELIALNKKDRDKVEEGTLKFNKKTLQLEDTETGKPWQYKPKEVPEDVAQALDKQQKEGTGFTGGSEKDLANVLDNVGKGGIESGNYDGKEAEAQTNAANKLAEEKKVEEKKVEEKKVEEKKEPVEEPDFVDKMWMDKGYVQDDAGDWVVPKGKKLDPDGNIIDDPEANMTAEEKDLKKWNGNKEAYAAFQEAKTNILNDKDLRADLVAKYKEVVEDEGNYTGKQSSTKKGFKTKYYDELSKMGDDDIINELLAQEERNARLEAFGHDASKTSQRAGALGNTTNVETEKFVKAHPELADLDWTSGHKGQAAYIAYNQLMGTDKYEGYAAEQFGVSDEDLGGVVGKISGIDRYSTNTTLRQRLNYKGKPKPPEKKRDCPPGTVWNEATQSCDSTTTITERKPCPPGHYVDEQGNCVKLPDWKPKDKFQLPGLLQLVPVGYAMMNPYQKDKGIPGSPGITGPLMPRVNLNQERASATSSQVAVNTAIQNQNMGPGAISAMIATAGKTNEQMLKIARQEQDSNKQLASEEAKLGMQASMFNVENEQKRQMVNADIRVNEKKYKREEILGTLDAAVNRITGIAKDDRMFKANERLAKAMDETGSYDRFTLYEQLQKEAKNKKSPMYGKNEVQLRDMAAGYSKLFYGDRGIVADQFDGQNSSQTQTQQKLGGARQYTSRLGELTKRPKLRIK